MDLMAARRRLLMQQRSRLPTEYREVAWLESTGTQYINTGLGLGTDDFSLEVTFEKTLVTSSEQAVVSIWYAATNYWNLFLRNAANGNVIDVYTAGHHNGNVVALNTKYTATLTRASSAWSCTFDGSTFSWTYTPSQVNTWAVKLFTRGDAPNTTSSNTHIKMYSFRINIAGVLRGDFVPCVRKADSKQGMYDLVTNTFFTNARTTGDDFIVPA